MAEDEWFFPDEEGPPGEEPPPGGAASSGDGPACHQGEITELYRFVRGAAQWRYAAASREVVADVDGAGPRTYLPAAITRGPLGLGPEAGRRTLELRCPPDLDVVRPFRGAPQPQPMGVSVHRRRERGGDWVLLWTGRVLQVVFEEGVARIRCEPASVSLRRTGLRRLYTRRCPQVLYGPECGVVPVAEAYVVREVDGRVIGLEGASAPEGRFAGGYLERADGTRHMIEKSEPAFSPVVSTRVTLAYPAPLALGEAVSLYAGCDRTLQTCRDRFANTDNFGGFPWIPRKNPFSENAY